MEFSPRPGGSRRAHKKAGEFLPLLASLFLGAMLNQLQAVLLAFKGEGDFCFSFHPEDFSTQTLKQNLAVHQQPLFGGIHLAFFLDRFSRLVGLFITLNAVCLDFHLSHFLGFFSRDRLAVLLTLFYNLCNQFFFIHVHLSFLDYSIALTADFVKRVFEKFLPGAPKGATTLVK